MQRRSLILTALAAPFIARTPGLLMPVRPWRGAIVGDGDFTAFHIPGDALLFTGQADSSRNGVWYVLPGGYISRREPPGGMCA